MLRRLFAVVLLSSLTGCGGGASSSSDPDSARAALETALAAWKGGETPESLLNQSPAMHVADYRWEAGYKLTAYTISESTATSGFDRRYPVELRLTNPKGKATKERAVYNVATSPSLTVVRDPES